MRCCPARRARDKAQTPLQSEIINFIYHAINIIRQGGTLRFNAAINSEHIGHGLTTLHQRIGRKAHAFEGGHHA